VPGHTIIAPIAVGFFGKLPARGDFVRAGLSRRFTDRWDRWLQLVLPVCRQSMGPDWDRIWHAAPAWRFALTDTIPVIGLFMPSIDRAGRHFALTIAAEGVSDDAPFLDAVEQAGRDAIGLEFAPDMLLARLQDLVPPPPALPTRADVMTRWWTTAHDALAFDGLPDAAALERMLAR
jgi:type VI secretion system protein ImpM